MGVCRQTAFKLGGSTAEENEAFAVKMDEKLSKDLLPLASTMQGYTTTTRRVCKAQWDYEFEVVFAGLDNFRAFIGKKDELGFSAIEDAMPQEFAAKDSVKVQNFVISDVL